MRVVAIVQARMGSSRLPGKVLADLCGDTMLARVVARLRAASRIDDIVIATSTAAADAAIVREAARLGVACYCGPEQDVLTRFVGAAQRARADSIVRVTADCPLLDPGVVDDVVAALYAGADYASNTIRRTFPRGLDVEALHRDTLELVALLGDTLAAREHVTSLVMDQPQLFRVRQVLGARDDSDLRWTVDTAEDLAFVRALSSLLGLGNHILPYGELVQSVRARPELRKINAHVRQRTWSARRGGALGIKISS